jgi:hypothetical protein
MSVLIAVLVLGSGAARAQKGPAVPDLLKLAGDYLTQYSQKLAATAAEEEYLQYETSTGKMATPKRLTSDVVWLGRGDGSIEGYRDVVALDHVAVRPKDERLLVLFRTPAATSLSQAKQLTEDGVRHYVDVNMHVLDDPLLTLAYLRPANQERSTFKIDGVKTMNGIQVAVLKFTEKGTDRIISSSENAAAVGRFWIDTASGAVRQTELGLGGRMSNVHVTVKYVSDAASGLWLPADMFQVVSVSGAGSTATNNMGSGGGYNAHQALEGHATYTKYRQIPVDLAKLR